jgi:hypothetical protein
MKYLRIISILLLISWLGGVELHATSYAALDKKIVAAYNASPKRTQDVYRYAMQILEKTNLDRSRKGRKWEDKSQKLITVVCYIEADRAIDNNDNQKVYLWALRGTSNGAARGELDGISIKQVYDQLNDLVTTLRQTTEIKELKYGKTRRQVADYRTVKPNNRVFPRDKKALTGQIIEKNKNYTVQEGPAQDNSGMLYVKIRYNFGGMLTIKYHSKRGWQTAHQLNQKDATYYPTWQACAAANAKTGNLPGVPVSVIKNKKTANKIYYVPIKAIKATKARSH